MGKFKFLKFFILTRHTTNTKITNTKLMKIILKVLLDFQINIIYKQVGAVKFRINSFQLNSIPNHVLK